MNRRRSSRMAVVARAQQLREQRARVRLQSASETHRRQRGMLEQLERYRSEYMGLNAAAPGPTSLALLRNSSKFVTDLSISIARQQQVEQQAWQKVKEARDAWQAEAARLDALESLASRCKNEELRELAHIADRDALDIWQAGARAVRGRTSKPLA